MSDEGGSVATSFVKPGSLLLVSRSPNDPFEDGGDGEVGETGSLLSSADCAANVARLEDMSSMLPITIRQVQCVDDRQASSNKHSARLECW